MIPLGYYSSSVHPMIYWNPNTANDNIGVLEFLSTPNDPLEPLECV